MQQRFQGYKDQTEALNEDQRKAIASMPTLEATIKELQDVVKLLEVSPSFLLCSTQLSWRRSLTDGGK
jgi:hypothetical protein